MQILARLETYRAARRNRYLGAGTRIPADAGLPWTYVEDSKATQLNPLSLGQCVLQAFEDRIHGMLGLVPRQAGTFDDAMNNVLLDQSSTSGAYCPPESMLPRVSKKLKLSVMKCVPSANGTAISPAVRYERGPQNTPEKS